jgi:hypothetical protein
MPLTDTFAARAVFSYMQRVKDIFSYLAAQPSSDLLVRIPGPPGARMTGLGSSLGLGTQTDRDSHCHRDPYILQTPHALTTAAEQPQPRTSGRPLRVSVPRHTGY